MESTGKYWIPIFNYLDSDIDICPTHPKYVKVIKSKKDISARLGLIFIRKYCMMVAITKEKKRFHPPKQFPLPMTRADFNSNLNTLL